MMGVFTRTARHRNFKNRERHYRRQRPLVTKVTGRRWVTREPACVFLSHKKYWFNYHLLFAGRDNGISILLLYGQPTYLDEEALSH